MGHLPILVTSQRCVPNTKPPLVTECPLLVTYPQNWFNKSSVVQSLKYIYGYIHYLISFNIKLEIIYFWAQMNYLIWTLFPIFKHMGLLVVAIYFMAGLRTEILVEGPSIKDVRKFLPIFYPSPLSACVRIFRLAPTPHRTSDFFLKNQHHSIMIIMNFLYLLLFTE